MTAAPWSSLSKHLQGQLLTGPGDRRLYATDASPLETLPDAVACPKHETDCQAIVSFCAEHHIPIRSRGAGTGLAGQSLGKGLVMNFSRWMNNIQSVDRQRRILRVQPGAVVAAVNEQLAAYHLRFGPDPSSANRATLGGMFGNNAWGSHVLRDGDTRQQIVAVHGFTAAGQKQTWNTETSPDSLLQFRNKHLATIQGLAERFQGLINNAGYPLHLLSEESFNPAQLLCGTEGSLFIATQLEVRVLPTVEPTPMLGLHFQDLNDALLAVPHLLEHQPAALELIDHNIIHLARSSAAHAHHCSWIQGQPAAILLVEMADAASAHHLAKEASAYGVQHAPVLTGESKAHAFAVRRGGLGLLMHGKDGKQAVTGIEDGLVPSNKLCEYVQEAQAIGKARDIDLVVYGSVGAGLVQLRPWMDVHHPEHQQRWTTLVQDIGLLAARLGGTPTGKHGDGAIRAPFLEAALGTEFINACRDLKQQLDPDHILNPGSVLPVENEQVSLRTPVESKSDIHPASNASLNCHGAGVCIRLAGTGAMCPTWQASGEEQYSTRGRANLIRDALKQGNEQALIQNPDLNQALSSCLGCKSCRSECPAGVDVARVKQRWAYLQNLQHFSLSRRLRAHAGSLIAWQAKLGPFALWFNRQTWIQSLIGRLLRLAPGEAPPLPQEPPCDVKHLRTSHSRIGILSDPYTRYLEPQVLKDTLYVLEQAGIEPVIADISCDLRAPISEGYPGTARKHVLSLLPVLQREDIDEWIVLEPAEYSALMQDVDDILSVDEQLTMQSVRERLRLFETFAHEHLSTLPLSHEVEAPKKHHYHPHCHQRSLDPSNTGLRQLQDISKANIQTLPPGCCGMAGVMGLEPTHREWAHTLTNQLLSDVDQNDELIVSGFSCREQFHRKTGKRPLHPASWLATRLT